MVSIQRAASLHNVGRTAIEMAIHKGKLKATKVKNRWQINIKDLNEYIDNRWKRGDE